MSFFGGRRRNGGVDRSAPEATAEEVGRGANGAGAYDPSRSAGELMKPLPARLALHHSVAAARELMWAGGFSFLVVVAPVTGKLLGVVLRRTLERGCEPRGHDSETCPLVRHLSTDFDFCLEGERIGEVFGESPTAIPGGVGEVRTPESRRRNAIPVIVVDEFKVPVGLLKRPKGSVVLEDRA